MVLLILSYFWLKDLSNHMYMNNSNSLSCTHPIIVCIIFRMIAIRLIANRIVEGSIHFLFHIFCALMLEICTSYTSYRLTLFYVCQIVALKKSVETQQTFSSYCFLLVKLTYFILYPLFSFFISLERTNLDNKLIK